MTAYYNEFDPYAAAWLRNLISAGHIAPGDVDERSIVDVRPDDVKGYTQVHFFAGIGGWSLAARLAGWPDARPLWTGSCPCQPFSAAGKRAGEADARHLWPEMRRLVSACRPPVVAGEQVASKDGRVWLAGVRTDLEDVAYDVWAADTCAAGAGAPHIRQRLYWLADAVGERRTRERLLLRPETAGRNAADLPEAAGSGGAGGLADADGGLARHGHLQSGGQHGQQPQDGGVVGGLADADSGQRGRLADGEGRQPDRSATRRQQGDRELERGGATGGLEHTASDGRQQRRTEPSERGAVGGCGEGVERLGDDDDARLALGSLEDDGRRALRVEGPPAGPPGPFGPWSRYDVVHCTDGKARRFESGSFPLAHGVSNRVGRLRAYGNAIVPQVAAQVLGAYLDGRSLRVTEVYDVSSDGVFA